MIYLYNKADFQGFGYLNYLPLWQIKMRTLALLMIAHQVLKCGGQRGVEVQQCSVQREHSKLPRMWRVKQEETGMKLQRLQTLKGPYEDWAGR